MEHERYEESNELTPAAAPGSSAILEYSPQTESIPTSDSVADRLRDMIAARQSSETASASSEVEQSPPEIAGSQSMPPKITSTTEYFDTQEGVRLELRKLAHRYNELKPAGSYASSSHREHVLQRPDWSAHFPHDTSEAETTRWESFVAAYPSSMQASLRKLYELQADLSVAHTNPDLMRAAQSESHENHEMKKRAITRGAIGRNVDRLRSSSQDIVWRAARDGEWSPSERDSVAQNNSDVELYESLLPELVEGLTAEQLKQLVVESSRLEALRDRAALNKGLLLTEQMQEIERKHLASLIAGEGLMLIGETGGAKTALAKDLAINVQRLLGRSGEGYEFVSAYGDINSYQLMGKQELRKQDDATVTEFAFGSITRAMRDGRPIIIDEFNAMPAEVSKVLNEIVTKRPGQSYAIQQNGGQEIVIREGFCIIATANDKSDRYKGVEKSSAEMENRFFASQERVHYPDHDVELGQMPPELLRLAVAGLADAKGDIPLEQYGLTQEKLINLLKAAHITQRLFSEKASTAMSLYVTDSQIKGSKTGLEERVISPRAMMAIFAKLRTSGGAATLESILASAIDAIPQSSPDRAVMEKILKMHDLLPQELSQS